MPHIQVVFLKSAKLEFSNLPDPIQMDILKRIKDLQELPRLGQAMEQAYEGYRCLLVGRRQYRLIYRILNDEMIEITYIRHCRRQLGLRPVH